MQKHFVLWTAGAFSLFGCTDPLPAPAGHATPVDAQLVSRQEFAKPHNGNERLANAIGDNFGGAFFGDGYLQRVASRYDPSRGSASHGAS